MCFTRNIIQLFHYPVLEIESLILEYDNGKIVGTIKSGELQHQEELKYRIENNKIILMGPEMDIFVTIDIKH